MNYSLFTSILLIIAYGLQAQPESYYTKLLAQRLDGVTEHKVQSGRVDIFTDQYAIEVKRASDWKHSIGQALWYAQQTNRQPGIILIMKSMDDRKYGIMLETTLQYAELDKVKVWFYPEDFEGSLSRSNTIEQSYMQEQESLQASGCTYWINTGSKKKTRHNQSCRWYNNTKKGRCTSTKEGSPCGQCGG